VIKASELKGRAVVSLERVQKIGVVQGILFDATAAGVAGLKVAATDASAGTFFVPARAVYSIGPDAITVRTVEPLPAASGDTAGLQGLSGSEELADAKVVTDGGTLLGTISDVYLDESTLQVQSYELGGAGLENLLGKKKFLPAQPGYRLGQAMLLVPAAVAGAVHPMDQGPGPGGPAVPGPGYSPPPAPQDSAPGVPGSVVGGPVAQPNTEPGLIAAPGSAAAETGPGYPTSPYPPQSSTGGGTAVGGVGAAGGEHSAGAAAATQPIDTSNYPADQRDRMGGSQ
jgi:uncharacterized protein YrrD